MPDYTAEFVMIDGQLDELEKIAVSAGVGRLIGAGIGVTGGAGAGYLSAPEGQKAQRAIQGGILGGLAGLAGGQAATQAGRLQAKQFGQRQLHGATGYLPGRGLFGNKGDKLDAAGRVKALQNMGWKGLSDPDKAVKTVRKGAVTPTKGVVTKAIQERPERTNRVAKALSDRYRNSGVDRALTKNKLRAQAAQQMLAEEGLTSIPGLAKGYAAGTENLGRAGVLKANLLAPGLVAGIGLPAAFAAPGIVEGVRQRDYKPAVRGVVDSAAYSLGGGLPLAAAAGLGMGLSSGVGHLLGKPQTPQSTAVDASGQLPGRLSAVQHQAGRLNPHMVR